MQDTLHHIPTSPTLGMNQKAKAMISEGRNVYRFGFGESPFQPPASVVKAIRENAHVTNYGEVQGEEHVREAIAAFHSLSQGINCQARDVVVAPGSKMLLFVIMACFRKADVLIPQPAWVSYAPQASVCGHHAIAMPCTFEERWRASPEVLRTAISKKKHSPTILILNQPGNPDGMGYSREELEALASIAREHDVMVISDEIYSLLSHSAEHIPMATIYSEGTITTTGLSKWCGAGGWRLGVALLPPSLSTKIRRTLIGVCSETYSCTSLPIQAAAYAAYKDYDEVRPYLEEQNRILRSISSWIMSALSTSEIKVHPSTGGFYLFPDFSAYSERLSKKGIKTSEALCNCLLEETGVALLPGIAFGCPEDQLTARLAYVDFNPPTELLTFSMEKHASHLQQGIGAMLDWLKTL